MAESEQNNSGLGRSDRGILDTSVVIDLDQLTAEALPLAAAISTVTLSELAAGPHATDDPDERARRQDLLQRAEVLFEPLPLDRDAARAFGRIYAAVRASGRKPRARIADLLIAATAAAAGLPLYTRNPDDFRHLEELVDVQPV